MSVEELIREYERTDRKDIAIRNLSSKYNISEREVIGTLEKYNIKIPKTALSRVDAIDLDNLVNEVSKDIELDKEVYTSVRLYQFRWCEIYHHHT